jgi:hypothetical protein
MDLLDLARRIAGAFPDVVEEVVVTGSVSRGVADELSDIEMLVVTRDEVELEECFALAAGAGLEGLGTWGPQGGPTRRVSGYREGVPIELIWWSGAFADERVAAKDAAEAIAHGVALRTSGRLARWQAQLAEYPDELALARIDDAALTWGGFAPEGLLTLTRAADPLALVERMVDDAQRVLRLLYALNRKWQPTSKRLVLRVESLAVKPDRLAERIEDALTAPDPRKALLVMTRLQLDTVNLAPDTPNVVRARDWLARGIEILEAC